jgi:hypothetical protein
LVELQALLDGANLIVKKACESAPRRQQQYIYTG